MAYNTKAVSKITGLTARQLDYWDTSHFIKPSVQEAAGSGTTRLYSFIDLVCLKVAKTLKDNGVSLQKLRKSIDFLRKRYPEIENPMAELKFLTDGENIFVLTDEPNIVLDTIKKGQLVMALALGEIVQGLNGAVKEFAKEKKYSVSVNKKKYEVILHPDTEDGGYWVECLILPGCASQGDTVEEALGMIKDAIKGYLDVAEQPQTEKGPEESYHRMTKLHNLKPERVVRAFEKVGWKKEKIDW